MLLHAASYKKTHGNATKLLCISNYAAVYNAALHLEVSMGPFSDKLTGSK